MKRDGKTLNEVPKGDRRRISDGKNAYRKMTPMQRMEFLGWIDPKGEIDVYKRNRLANRGPS